MSDHILVLGANGFIGQHLVKALSREDKKIIAVGRNNVDFDLPNVETIIADLRTPDDFTPLIARSHSVAYLASASTPGTSAGRPYQEVSDNVQVLAGLLEAMQDYPQVNLLYFSSGGSLYTSPSEESAGETAAIRPLSYHGAAKIAAEYFIAAWCSQYSGKATILRPSNVYDPGQFERAGFGIVPTALGKIKRREQLHVWGDGSSIRLLVY